MIFDAKVEVTCDHKTCRASVFIDLPAGARNSYIADDDDIERMLIKQEEWFVVDGKHYCCEGHQP